VSGDADRAQSRCSSNKLDEQIELPLSLKPAAAAADQ